MSLSMGYNNYMLLFLIFSLTFQFKIFFTKKYQHPLFAVSWRDTDTERDNMWTLIISLVYYDEQIMKILQFYLELILRVMYLIEK